MAEPHMVFLIILIVWAAIYLASRFFPLIKYGLEITPIYVMYRTEKFNSFLKRIAEKNKRFWRTFANVGVAVAAVEIFLAIYFLTNNLYRFIYVPQEAAPIVPLFVGITIDLKWLPYVLVAIGLGITIHEMAHGVLAFLEKIPVKSSGLIFAVITFGGFVEPDEDSFQKASLLSKLRMLAAGSLINIITGLVTLLLLMAVFVPFSGVLVINIAEDGPAYIAGIRPWEIIYSIDGHEIDSIADLTRFMTKIGPGIALNVMTSSGIKNITTVASSENSTRGIIGVVEAVTYSSMRIGENYPQLSYHLYWILYWISLLMINVAIFNMLPLFPFDGEAFIFSILKDKLKTGLKVYRIFVNLFSVFLLVSNIGLTFFTYGLIPI